MTYKIKPLRGVPDRLYAYREGSEQPIGSFKDYLNGTIYTSVKHPKGEIDIVGMKAADASKKLYSFLELIDTQKIPNTVFRAMLTSYHLTEEGFKEFLQIIFPKRKAKAKTTRRYYLHGKIKKCKCVKMGATDKTIFVTDTSLPGIDDKIKAHIFELRDKHGYSIQQEIPNAKG
jgi:hypothetical protein